jgi:hypothetical protein
MKALYVFGAMLLTDYLWARYIKHTAKGEAVQSALHAMALLLCTALVTIAYVHDPRLIVPAVLGAGVGTYMGVR